MTKRKEAIKWWNDMSHSEKGLYMEGEFKHRHPQSLTGREIETLYDDKCRSDAEIIEEAFKNRSVEIKAVCPSDAKHLL